MTSELDYQAVKSWQSNAYKPLKTVLPNKVKLHVAVNQSVIKQDDYDLNSSSH